MGPCIMAVKRWLLLLLEIGLGLGGQKSEEVNCRGFADLYQ